MAKNKGTLKNKNVFKVATVRSIKSKAKAQKVTTNLKKLDSKGSKVLIKDKTANVDYLLEELRKDVSNSKAKFQSKLDITQKKSTKLNKRFSAYKVTPEQTDTAASMVEQMKL